MAIDGISGARSSYRENWENNGGAYGNEGTEGTEGSNGTSHIWDAVFTDKKENSVSVDDFLSLMVAQMTNQDFMNPMDDTQFVTQLAQFSSMQMMQEMANYSKTSYVMSLVGQKVTAAKISPMGGLQKETGPVQKVTLTNNEFGIWVNDKKFSLEQIMEIGGTSSSGDSDSTDTDNKVEDDTSRKEYLNSLIGREVTITIEEKDETGSVSIEVTGTVEKVSTKDDKFRVYVEGKWYSMDDITEVGGKDVQDVPPEEDESTGTTPEEETEEA